MHQPLAKDYLLIFFSCPCRQRYRAQPHWAGKSLRCKRCGRALVVPGTPRQEPPPPRRRSPVWPYAAALAAVVLVNAVVIGMRHHETPVEVAVAEVEAVEPEDELEPEQEPEPVAAVEPAPGIPTVAAAPTPPAPPAPPAETDAEAAYKLGLQHETGEGVEQDFEAAAMHYEEAADAGHAEAMYKLGLCYCVGKGVEKDEETGKEWLKEAAKAGHPDANLALDAFKVAVPVAIATAWMTHPVGEGLRQKDKEAAEAEQAASSGIDAGLARMSLAYRLLGMKGGPDVPPRGRSMYEPWRKFDSPAGAQQRDRFIKGMQMQQRNAAIQKQISGK